MRKIKKTKYSQIIKVETMKIRYALGLLICWLISSEVLIGQDNEGERLFSTCMACHTIGGGKGVGPDLKGIAELRSEEWIIKFVQNSTELIASGDADAVSIFEEFNKIPMPPQALSDDQVRSIIAYISSKGSEESEDKGDAPVEEISYTDKEIAEGAKLFSGELRLSNGGASCISCHNVQYDEFMSGGGLAMDLTESKTRITATGISAMITNPGFPVMREAYKNNKITEDEVYKLTAFLVNVDDNKEEHSGSDSSNTLLFSGLGGLFLVLLLLAMLNTRTKAKSVNQAIYDRQLSSK